MQHHGANTEYIKTTPNVAIVNHDKETELIKSFREYVASNAKIVEIIDNEEKMQDALFYRDVECILVIPENYTDNFLNNVNTNIEVKKTSDGDAVYIEMLLNKYLKMVEIYNKSGMSQNEIIQSIKLDIKNECEVVVNNKKDISLINKATLYYNFANYSFLAISIYIISTLMLVFNDNNIKKRNKICKMSYKKISNQLFLGNVGFISIVWIAYVIISIILFKKTMFSPNGLLLILNSLLFIIVAAIIGFLISSFVKNRNTIGGIVNVVALGLSFISGCFVTQDFLDNTVITISKAFPSYWYIRNNELIADLTNFSLESLRFNN